MLTCKLCNAETETTETAIAAGWYPTYWTDETTEEDGPVCESCVASKCERGVHGEPLLKAEFAAS